MAPTPSSLRDVQPQPLTTVLFDLDGTLADTAPDLAFALNTVLVEQGRAALPFAHVRPVVSHGAAALIRLGFGLGPEDEGFAPLRTRLLEIYRTNLAQETRLFPGMTELLLVLERLGMKWGVVTNKPAWLTEPLLHALGVAQRTCCIVSGDTTRQRKPHPEPMLHACAVSGSLPEQCIYVGDAQRDVEAGRQAGMKTLVALFGYLDASDLPAEWGADGMVEHPLEILNWMEAYG